MHSIFVFHDIRKITDFHLKTADVSITQEIFHMIYIFLGSFLG